MQQTQTYDLTSLSLLLAFIFLFYYYGDHRDLHSFPTRRSSDLRSGERLQRGHRLLGAGFLGEPEDTVAIAVIVDRKSTRLNSSHSQISYAVFCLKKKKVEMSLDVC